jgi:hypothetical protein
MGALDRGAGRYFFYSVRLHLVLTIFPFPVSPAQFIGKFWTNRRSNRSDIAPTLLALYRTVKDATSLPALKGEAKRLRRANRRSAANLQRLLEVFADFFFIRCTSPTGRVRIAPPIVLAQLKENERIGIRHALTIVIEIPC